MRKEVTPVGFEPTQLALVELESTPLDHSGKVSFANNDVSTFIVNALRPGIHAPVARDELKSLIKDADQIGNCRQQHGWMLKKLTAP